MHITLDVLRRFTRLPDDAKATRVLLDEVGIEVKRVDHDAPGVPMTLELLANRGDHHAYNGLATEISGRTGHPVALPEVKPLTVGDSPRELVLDSDLCTVYTLTRLVKKADGQLPAASLDVLASAGLQSIGPVVDATNVAMLELGQPTHAFDAAKVSGAVVLRTARAGEKAWPLFEEGPREIPEGILVVADDEKILAIAGVIGCEESKTTEATVEVLLESAAFDPVSVRKAGRALNIQTDSKARFERGSDFSAPLVGAGRVAHLMEQAGWQVVGTTGQVGAFVDPERTIAFNPEAARTFLDITMDDTELAERLRRYGFKVHDGAGIWDVVVPPHRLWDVEFAADLYEELAKSIGYDNTPIGLPAVDMGAVPSAAERVRFQAEQVLLGHGLYEVITDGFYGRQMPANLGFEEGHPLHAHVETANALDRAYSLLKNNCLAQAVQGVADNLRMNVKQFRAYEFTRTFHPDANAANGLCRERKVLWAAVSGDAQDRTWAGGSRPADAIFLKGIVTELGVQLGLPFTFAPVGDEPGLADALHPGRRLAVELHGQRVGLLGEVHPQVVQAFRIKRARPCYLELDWEALMSPRTSIPYVEPSRLQDVHRSLAFTLPHGIEAGAVARVMTEQGPRWLKSVRMVDLFAHEEEGEPVRTVTYELTYTHDLGERSVDELNAASEALIEAVDQALGGRGVKLR